MFVYLFDDEKGSRFDVITQTEYQMQNTKYEIRNIKIINYNKIYDDVISINYYYELK